MEGTAPQRPRSAERKEPGSQAQDERRRSRSPRQDRAEERPKRKDTGFKWKEKRKDREDDGRRDRDNGVRQANRDRYRPKSRSPRRADAEPQTKSHEPEKKEGREKKEKKVVPPAPTEQPIRVFVNDRLGTKKEIPCYPSDSVKDFKAIVAMMIGRRPHEILLKRQGERPFKDMLTLQDYGVSNNVQLDLEVDTGD